MKYVKTYENVKHSDIRSELISILEVAYFLGDKINSYFSEFKKGNIYIDLLDKDFGEIIDDLSFEEEEIDSVIEITGIKSFINNEKLVNKKVDDIISYNDDLSLSILKFNIELFVPDTGDSPEDTIEINLNFWNKIKNTVGSIKNLELDEIHKTNGHGRFFTFFYKIENLTNQSNEFFKNLNLD